MCVCMCVKKTTEGERESERERELERTCVREYGNAGKSGGDGEGKGIRYNPEDTFVG